MNSSFTYEEELNLVNLIKQYPSIWNVYAYGRAGPTKRAYYWQNISKLMKKSELACRRKWRFLRENYLHCGQESNEFTNNFKKNYECLHFLTKLRIQRQSVPNASACEEFVDMHKENNVSIQTDEIPTDISYVPSCTNHALPESMPNKQINKVIKQYRTNIEDKSIDLFFQSIAATVKSFPPSLITQAKRIVFNAIIQMEKEMMLQAPNAAHIG